MTGRRRRPRSGEFAIIQRPEREDSKARSPPSAVCRLLLFLEIQPLTMDEVRRTKDEGRMTKDKV